MDRRQDRLPYIDFVDSQVPVKAQTLPQLDLGHWALCKARRSFIIWSKIRCAMAIFEARSMGIVSPVRSTRVTSFSSDSNPTPCFDTRFATTMSQSKNCDMVVANL